MKIEKIKNRNPLLIEQLIQIWKSSVKATHLFLSEHEIAEIELCLPQAFQEVEHLLVVKNDQGLALAFMGIVECKLEMLFVDAAQRGNGIGKSLLHHGIDQYGVNELCVNEQNPLAQKFYEHMGFAVYKRTEKDEQGRPYPLLYMKLISKIE